MSMTTRTTVRWSDREFSQVSLYAHQRNITVSAVIREVLMRHFHRLPPLRTD